MWIRNVAVISQERLNIGVKLLLSVNRKLHMLRRLAQQRMTLSDLEWPFRGSSTLNLTSSASRAISAVAELLVLQGTTRLS